LVVLLGLNQLVARVPAFTLRPWLFWPVIFLDLVVGSYVLAVGLPGFEHIPPVSWVVGLLFFLHIGQDLKLRVAHQQEAHREARATRLERAAELREQIVDADEA
jgi:uncharacterized membrane protein